MEPPHKLAIYDFDGTLIHGDSFIMFARKAAGRRFYIALLRALPHILAWKAGLISGGVAKEKLFSYLFRGMPRSEWLKKCDDFADSIDRSVRRTTAETLERDRSDGFMPVILTASPADWVRPWAHRAGIECVIGTEVETDSAGLLTGRFATPNCHGKEKVNRLLQTFPRAADCTTRAYGDSPSDKYILDFADEGHMIDKSKP